MAGKRGRGPLTAAQIADVAEAALSNAGQLITEARALLDANCPARAYSLAILAGEEFGKCQLAIGFVGRDGTAETDDYWREWWSTFYGHGPKLARAAHSAAQWLPASLLEEFVAILEPALKGQRREAGIYVDVRDGEPVSPTDEIEPAEAAHMVECFETVINSYAAAFPQGLASAFTETHLGEAASRMRAALESRDPEAISVAWAETTGRSLDDGELAAIMRTLADDGSES